MSKIFNVSTSGFYSWRNRIPSKRKLQNEIIGKEIEDLYFIESKKRYGSPKIHSRLQDKKINIGKNRVSRIMREKSLKSIVSKKFKVITTDSNHNHPVSPNLLNREFEVDLPNKVWVSDITYLRCNNDFIYLCQIKDLCTKKIVGWSLSERMTSDMVVNSLKNAVHSQKPDTDLIFHSDRGSQYASKEFRKYLDFYNIQQSMSRKGNCWDNAPAENFFSTLKREFTNHCEFKNIEEARLGLFEYIEIFYNRVRVHAAIGYKTPEEFERLIAA